MTWDWDFVADLSWIWLWAGFFAFLATMLSVVSMYQHLMNYTAPHLQRYIVRIILMVPIYAIDSWISLRWISVSVYLDVLRDAYEAYVVYTFFTLLISFINTYDHIHSPNYHAKSQVAVEIGSESDHESEIELDDTSTTAQLSGIDSTSIDEDEKEDVVIRILRSKDKQSHPFPFNYCLPKFQPGKRFLTILKRLVYQFVIIKPILAFTVIILQYEDLYDDGDISLDSAYLYMIIIDNISVTCAMYALVLFYSVTKEELTPFNPIPKFLCIKAVILFAFWQGIIISVLVWFNLLHGNEDFGWSDRDVSVALQDFLICIEMFLISIAHRFTFSHKPYRSGEASCEDIPCYSVFCCCCCCFKVTKNLTHVVSQKDVLQDGVEIFSINKMPDKISNLGKGAKNAVGSLWVGESAPGEVEMETIPNIPSDDASNSVENEL